MSQTRTRPLRHMSRRLLCYRYAGRWKAGECGTAGGQPSRHDLPDRPPLTGDCPRPRPAPVSTAQDRSQGHLRLRANLLGSRHSGPSSRSFRRPRETIGPEAAAIYTGRGSFDMALCDIFQPAGVAVSSASSVLFPFGSPNTLGVGALCYVSFAMIAPHVTMGEMLITMETDLEQSELIVIWGANPATDSPPTDSPANSESTAARGGGHRNRSAPGRNRS